MKIKDFTINRSATNLEVAEATVNNKTTPTSEQIITDLSLVLLEIYTKERERKNE